MLTINSEISQESDLPTQSINGESDDHIKKSKRKIYIWAILWAIFPPILVFAILASIFKPAIKGKEPVGIYYILWILGLLLLGAILELPFGTLSSVAEALTKPVVCGALLFADVLATVLGILLIVFTFRRKIPNPYVPLTKFKVDNKIIILWFLSLLPLLSLLSTKTIFSNPDNITNPLVIAMASSLKNGAYLSVVMGMLSIGLLGPVFEEMIFRGLLLETSHERNRSKGMRYLLDLVVCVFFAILHLPSFIVPLILAATFIYVRRHSGSLWPSIFMHASWNTSILIVMFMSRQSI